MYIPSMHVHPVNACTSRQCMYIPSMHRKNRNRSWLCSQEMEVEDLRADEGKFLRAPAPLDAPSEPEQPADDDAEAVSSLRAYHCYSI